MTPPPPLEGRPPGGPPRPRIPGWLPAAITLALFLSAGALFYRDTVRTEPSSSDSGATTTSPAKPEADSELDLPERDDSDADDDSGSDTRDVDGDVVRDPASDPELAALRGTTIAIDAAGGTRSESADAATLRVAVGGYSPTCLGQSTGGAGETAATLATARELRDLLEAAGASVVLVRDADDGTTPCTDVRVQRLEDADIAVVIGADSGHGWRVLPSRPERPAGGGEPATSADIDRARQLAAELVGALDAALPGAAGPDPSDGRTPAMAQADAARRANVGAIDMTGGAASVFIDIGDLRVAADAARLADAQQRAELVHAIAIGLATWTLRTS